MLSDSKHAATPLEEGRVLFISDGAIGGEYTTYLQRYGFAVTAAPAFKTGLQLVLRAPFDIVILDIGESTPAGLRVARLLRGYLRMRRTPIICLCASAGAATIEAGANLALDHFCTPADLAQTIDVFLRRRK